MCYRRFNALISGTSNDFLVPHFSVPFSFYASMSGTGNDFISLICVSRFRSLKV